MSIPPEVAEQKANEIYNHLTDWITERFQGKDLRNSGPFLTPVSLHHDILEIIKKDDQE